MYVYIYIHIYTYTYIHTYTYVYIYTYMNTYVQVYICIYIYIYICMYIYTHKYIWFRVTTRVKLRQWHGEKKKVTGLLFFLVWPKWCPHERKIKKNRSSDGDLCFWLIFLCVYIFTKKDHFFGGHPDWCADGKVKKK